MADMTIQIKDYTPQVLQSMNAKIATALEAVGHECENYARDDAPVDTGRLRNSITHKVMANEKKVYIGTNVEYAVYQEYGDYNHPTGKKHFLRDAAATHADHYKEVIRAALN